MSENDPDVRKKIKHIVEACGVEQALAWLDETLTIEAGGGLLVNSGERRRTPGGAFFYLVKGRLPADVRRRLFPQRSQKRRRKSARQSAPPPAHAPKPLTPDELRAMLDNLLNASGEATTVKITLMGRPGQIEKHDKLIVTTMTYSGRQPSLPKGLPPWPDTSTTYVVYIAAKQWNNVEEAIANPEDSLIIEGHCAFDPALGQIAVYTTNVTTKFQQRARREQRDSGAASTLTDSKESPEQTAQSEAESATKTAVSEERTKRLEELKRAEQTALERVEAIQSLPPSERTGLMSAMKELQKIRAEIQNFQP